MLFCHAVLSEEWVAGMVTISLSKYLSLYDTEGENTNKIPTKLASVL
jgi:hypothetical protein